jgi:hypothetical protein
MDTLFLLCAIFGGTVLIAQFFLGFGSDVDGGEDGPEDAPDALGADAHGDGTHHDSGHHNSTWIFGVLTFRTVIIGLTFFGLTGKAAVASGLAEPRPLVIAVACGLAAMYGVYFLMRGLYRLTADGTERIDRAVGEQAIVYLAIPGHSAGVGKIHVTVQNRTIEYEAMTAGERLPTGSRAVVVGVLSSDRVEVEAVVEPTGFSHETAITNETTEPARNSHV